MPGASGEKKPKDYYIGHKIGIMFNLPSQMLFYAWDPHAAAIVGVFGVAKALHYGYTKGLSDAVDTGDVFQKQVPGIMFDELTKFAIGYGVPWLIPIGLGADPVTIAKGAVVYAAITTKSPFEIADDLSGLFKKAADILTPKALKTTNTVGLKRKAFELFKQLPVRLGLARARDKSLRNKI